MPATSFLHFLSRTHRLLLVCCMFFSFAATAQQQPKAEKELQQVQSQIKQTEQDVKQQQRQLEQAEKKLQQADKALADAARKVQQTASRKKQAEQEISSLEQQQSTLQKQLAEQQHLLAAQLKGAYSLGQHDYSRLLLNQDDTGKLERLLTYYHYFNQARIKQLAEINQTADELTAVLDKLTQQQQLLISELQALEQQQQQLSLARNEQQASITQLQQVLAKQGNQLTYLRQNETSLQNTINELRRKAELSKEMAGLKKGKGRFPWPLKGSLLQRFGQSRQGGMTSQGIIIKANSGHEVNAIAAGRVIYADWLKGYGWVIVLDHGAGFMSLYGHNQSLLKQPGDQVAASDVIALVGASGGQAETGLYFEIREKGDAVNPLLWLQQP